MKALDLLGKKFGRLTVVERAPSRLFGKKTVRASWKCICDCGLFVIVVSSSLVSGNTTSCGCVRKDSLKNEAGKTVKNRILASYKQGAKRRGLEWSISDEEFTSLIFGNCHYCDSAPQRTVYRCTKYRKDPIAYNGVDRVDNTLGYVSSNLVSCCKVCNKAKDVMSRDEFVLWVLKTADHIRRSWVF